MPRKLEMAVLAEKVDYAIGFVLEALVMPLTAALRTALTP